MIKKSLVLLAGFLFPSLLGRAKDKIDEKNLSSWKLLDDFRRRLANERTAVPARERRPGGPERLLLEEDYFNLMLFGLFNPVLNSMRGLCAASYLRRRNIGDPVFLAIHLDALAEHFDRTNLTHMEEPLEYLTVGKPCAEGAVLEAC